MQERGLVEQHPSMIECSSCTRSQCTCKCSQEGSRIACDHKVKPITASVLRRLCSLTVSATNIAVVGRRRADLGSSAALCRAGPPNAGRRQCGGHAAGLGHKSAGATSSPQRT